MFSLFQVLLAFGKDDLQSDAFCLACEKLGYDCNLARTRETVLEAFQAKSHEIVVIDTRNPKTIDGESVCRQVCEVIHVLYRVIENSSTVPSKTVRESI
jgi:DNA-binding response OmpR family regulator